MKKQERDKVKITKEILETFNPCEDRWENYMKHYSKWTGTLLGFMSLDKLSAKDKIWVFSKEYKELEVLQRRFACLCMDRCQTDIEEVNSFQLLVLLMYESTDYTSIEHLKDEAYRAADNAAARAADWAAVRAADWAAARAADWATARAADSAAYSAAARAADWAAARATDSAAYRAAEREVQVEIIKYLLQM